MTFEDLSSEIEDLLDRIESATVVTGFDENGGGPFASLVDHAWNGPGPIRKQAARLRSLLRQAHGDFDSAMRAKGSL